MVLKNNFKWLNLSQLKRTGAKPIKRKTTTTTNKQATSLRSPDWSVIFTLRPYLTRAHHCTHPALSYLSNSPWDAWGRERLIHSCSKVSCHTCTAALRKAQGVSVNNHKLTEGLNTRSTCMCSSLLSPEGEAAQGGKIGHQIISALARRVCFHRELCTLTHSVNNIHSIPTMCQPLSYTGPCPLGMFSSGKREILFAKRWQEEGDHDYQGFGNK